MLPRSINFNISAIAPFTITVARSEVVTFGHPIAIVHDNLFIKNPAQILNLMAYFEPYKFKSWILVGALFLTTSTILFSVVRYVMFALPEVKQLTGFFLTYS